jgi:hypothetical protein
MNHTLHRASRTYFHGDLDLNIICENLSDQRETKKSPAVPIAIGIADLRRL